MLIVSYIWNITARALTEVRHLVDDLSFEDSVLPRAIQTNDLERIMAGLRALEFDEEVIVRREDQREISADEAVAIVKRSEYWSALLSDFECDEADMIIEVRPNPFCWVVLVEAKRGGIAPGEG